MKTINHLFLFIFLTIGIVSCTDKKEELKQQYIEACADGDFDKARASVQKLEAVDRYKAEEGMKYVNDKEIYALLAKPSREADSRIMYLYNIYEYNQLPDMTDVLEVAISTERTNLAEKLLKSGVTPGRSTIAVAVSTENEDIVDIILQKQPDYLFEEGVAEFYKQTKGQDALTATLKQLWASVPSNNEYERNQIIGLAKKFDISDFDKLIAEAAIADIETEIKALYEIKVPTCPASGRVKSDHYGDIPEEYQTYRKAVEDYNNECLKVINDALDNNLPQMAKRVLSLMKPNLEWNDLGDWEDVVTHSGNGSVYNCFLVKQNRTELEHAQKLIQQYGK